jgi:hypothetical protein
MFDGLISVEGREAAVLAHDGIGAQRWFNLMMPICVLRTVSCDFSLYAYRITHYEGFCGAGHLIRSSVSAVAPDLVAVLITYIVFQTPMPFSH